MTSEEYLALIVGPLLKHPEDIAIERKTEESGDVLYLSPHEEDRGVCRGRQTASSLRQLFAVSAYQNREEKSIGLTVVSERSHTFKLDV